MTLRVLAGEKPADVKPEGPICQAPHSVDWRQFAPLGIERNPACRRVRSSASRSPL